MARSRLVQALIGLLAAVFIAFMLNIAYTRHYQQTTDHKSDQRWCDLFANIIIPPAPVKDPVAAARSKRFYDSMTRLQNSFGCKSG